MVSDPLEPMHDGEEYGDEEHGAWITPRRPLLDRITSDLHARWHDVRVQWDPNVTTAAVVTVDRNLLADEPRLKAIIAGDLHAKIQESYPLRWRYDDARHRLRQAWRAVRGLQAEPVPWEQRDNVILMDDNAVWTERNLVAIRAERHRVRTVRA